MKEILEIIEKEIGEDVGSLEKIIVRIDRNKNFRFFIYIFLSVFAFFLDMFLEYAFRYHEEFFRNDTVAIGFVMMFLVIIFSYFFEHYIDLKNEIENKLRKMQIETRITATKSLEAENFLVEIFDGLTDGVAVIDRDHKIVTANKAYCRQVNLLPTDVIGRKCHEVTHGFKTPCFQRGEKCPTEESFKSGRECEVMHKHGEAKLPTYVRIRSIPFLFDENGRPKFIIEILRDETEEEILREQLFHSQKLETIGRLAGGIAHDFNNILTTVLGYSEMIKLKLDRGSEFNKWADNIITASNRAKNLVQGLLEFSRKSPVIPKVVDLNDIVVQSENMLQPLIKGTDVKMKIDLCSENLVIKADAGKIEQIILNLVVNARDAMSNKGVISISTGRSICQKDYLEDSCVEGGSCAVLVIADNGMGIKPEDRKKIFEPFFTTKEAGKGTGLGLSIVYGIVKQHDGHIEMESEEGAGTTFRIYFPECSKLVCTC